MIKQTWTISNEEKSRILNLHETATKNQYLIGEQQIKPIKQFNITNSFKSGQYQLTDTSQIDSVITEIKGIASKTPNTQYDIVVTSSESKVPNRGVNMKPGELSLKRGQTAEQYLKSKLGDSMVIKINNLGAQGPEWDPSKGNDNPDYTKFQYVTIGMVVSGGERNTPSGKSVCSTDINGIGRQGKPQDNYVTTNESLDGNGDLILTTGSIPDRMVIYNQQKQIVKDTGYVATEPHKYTAFKYVPLYVSQLTRINGTVAVSGNKIITIEVQSFEELMKQLLVDPNKIPTGPELKSMGGEVSSGVIRLKKLFDSGVTKFVLYSIINSSSVLPFDGDAGDKSVVVMSPIGNTGYEIKGKC